MAKIEFSKGDIRCVYCGKTIPADERVYRVKTETRDHPVCSPECQAATEDFIEKDLTVKKFMYFFLVAAVVFITVGTLVLSGSMLVNGIGILVAGMGLYFFPYPASYFDTFYSNCIKTVTSITKKIGIFLMVLGVILMGASLIQ